MVPGWWLNSDDSATPYALYYARQIMTAAPSLLTSPRLRLGVSIRLDNTGVAEITHPPLLANIRVL